MIMETVIFPPRPGVRAVVHVDVERVSSPCGFAVPLYDYAGDRDLLHRWAERKTPAEMQEYRLAKNSLSADGLSALPH